MNNALVLLAGGEGNRLKSSNIPKQFINFDNKNIIEYFLDNLDHDIFDIIVIVVDNHNRKKYLLKLKKNNLKHNIRFVNSGKTRQHSSEKGILYLLKNNPKKVLIHDAARPLVSNKLIRKLIKKLDVQKSCIPYIRNNDLIKKKYTSISLDCKNYMHIQTPQAFKYKLILNAHKKNKLLDAKDDSELIENIGMQNNFIKGEKTNIKITFDDDIDLFNKIKNTVYRSGIGYDIHPIDYKSKKYLKLCGVTIPHKPLIGHSDADVGFHAICDSILGSLSLRDIGYYFKNNEKKWKNINSIFFMKFCKKKLDINNYQIINLDINFICETPKINNYVIKMKKNISKVLDLNIKNISIKATTNEKIGFIGNGKGIAAEAVVQIKNV